MFDNTFRYNPDASQLPPDSSDLSFSPPRIRQKTFKRPTLTSSKANRSFRDELTLSDNPDPNISLSELSRNQKGGLSLVVDHQTLKYKYVIASKGISQQGWVTWTCCSRGCKAKVKTKVLPELVAKKQVKGKNCFFFKEPLSLTLDDFDIDGQKEVTHQCEPLTQADIFNMKISAKALEISAKMVAENPSRKLLRSEIIDQATASVQKSMPEPESPLRLKKLNIARKISRYLRKNGNEIEDITHENFQSYSFDGLFQEDKMKLDVEFARSTSNSMLLFYSMSVLSQLRSGKFHFLGDGTFPLGRGNIFEQVFIGLITNNDIDQIAFFVWMQRRRKEDYRKVLLWIRSKIGGPIRVMRICTDREIALYSAVSEIFEKTGENFCVFHAITNFKRRFEREGLSSLLPAKNRKSSTQNGCFTAHCWHCIQLCCYFPISFIGNFIDYLVHNVIVVLDPRLEERLKAVLLSIKMDFANNNELSWYHAMTVNGTAEYVDPTSNRIERMNGEIKTFLKNHVRGGRNISKIVGVKIWCDKQINQSMIFSNQAATQPDIFMRRRRLLILDLVDAIKTGPGPSQSMVDLIKIVDNRIWEFYGNKVQNANNDEFSYYSDDEDGIDSLQE